jgi:carbon monoxide dehydrogenase subunit G
MRVSYDAAVGQPIATVWASLTDVDSVLAALPAGAFERDAGVVTGSLKCKLGAAQITYRLSARAEVGDTEFHTAALAVTGKEARGSGTLAATLTLALRAEGSDTRIDVNGDVEVTGRGESASAETWSRVIGTLVSALVPPPAEAPPEPASPPRLTRPALVVAPPLDEPVPTRRGSRPLVVGIAAVLMLMLFRRRRRRRRR